MCDRESAGRGGTGESACSSAPGGGGYLVPHGHRVDCPGEIMPAVSYLSSLLCFSSEQQEHVSSVEEKLRSVRSSLQEVQLHCSQQKQTISELQAKNSQQSIEMDGLKRRIEELQQVRIIRPSVKNKPLHRSVKS